MRWGMKLGLLSMLLLQGACGGKSSTGSDKGDKVTFTLPTIEMVRIEPGTFMTGAPDSDASAQDWEKPQHQVTLTKGFYLGKYEVTQAQWTAVMGTTPWSGRKNGYGDERVPSNPDIPAAYVTWNDVQAFIHKLNVATGDSLYRLPTEAEWEYACRAGTTTRWSFGDDENQQESYMWILGDDDGLMGSLARPRPVGTKKPNPWGLYDMYGNVDEWVQDWHTWDRSGTQTDPTGPAVGSDRVYRGGSYSGGASSTTRYWNPPNVGYDNVGARLVRIK